HSPRLRWADPQRGSADTTLPGYPAPLIARAWVVPWDTASPRATRPAVAAASLTASSFSITERRGLEIEAPFTFQVCSVWFSSRSHNHHSRVAHDHVP